MALLYKPGTDSRGTVAPCPDEMVSGNDALAVRCTFFRRPVPNQEQKYVAEPEHGSKAGDQSYKETQKEDGIQTDHIKNHA